MTAIRSRKSTTSTTKNAAKREAAIREARQGLEDVTRFIERNPNDPYMARRLIIKANFESTLADLEGRA